MRVLFIGDIFARPGREFLLKHLDGLKQQHAIDITVANVENAAGGFGVTPEIARQFVDAGIDMMTSGNHIWNKKEISTYMQESNLLLRPINMPANAPGSGVGIVQGKAKKPLGVINVIGRVFVGNYECPFQSLDAALETVKNEAAIILVDFHAEATSEKRAFGWHCDGKVSAVVGTHTHVQTADECIMPQGTGYISDVGMTGPHDSVIGVEKEPIIEKFITQMPTRFNAATGDVQINGVVMEFDEDSGKCLHIERINVKEKDQ